VAQQLSRADKSGLVLAAYCKDPNDSSQALKFLCSHFRVFMLSVRALNMNGIDGEDITCLIQVNIAVSVLRDVYSSESEVLRSFGAKLKFASKIIQTTFKRFIRTTWPIIKMHSDKIMNLSPFSQQAK
jgi:hypothetical protein